MSAFVDQEVKFGGALFEGPVILDTTQVPRHLASLPVEEGFLLVDGSFHFEGVVLRLAGATIPAHFAGIVLNEHLVKLSILSEDPKQQKRELSEINKQAVRAHKLKDKLFFPETYPEVDDSRRVRIIMER